MTLSGHCRADCPCRGVTSGSTNRAEAFDELRAVDEWRMKAEVNAEAADRLGRMLEAAEAERDALRRQLLDETYRPEGGEIVMRELSRVKAERDEWRAGMERLRVENDHLLHPSMGETVTMRSRLTTLSEVLAGVKAERDALSARLQAVRDAVSEIRGERDRCKISADGWFGDGADPAKDYAVGALDGLDKALGWLERALDASLGTPGDEKPSFVHTLSSGVTTTGLSDELPPDLAAEVDRQLDAIDEARARAAASAANYIVRGAGSGDEKPQPCKQPPHAEFWSVHVHGPDDVVLFDSQREAEAYAAAIFDVTNPGGPLHPTSPFDPKISAHVISPVESSGSAE